MKTLFAEVPESHYEVIQKLRKQTRKTIRVLVMEAIESLAKKYHVPLDIGEFILSDKDLLQ